MEKIFYTTTAVNEDGLTGVVYTKGNGDKDFSVSTSSPRSADEGTNPEQLFALAYATCLNASIEFVEKRMKLEHKSKVEVKIDLTLDSEEKAIFSIHPFFVAMPGRDEALAREILEAAERQCPVHKLLKELQFLQWNFQQPMSNVLLRVATLEDAKAIQAIYAPYVETTAITFEEVVPSVEEFEGRIQKTLENFPYLVLEEDGEVVGYAYAGRFSARAAFDWSTEVSIYISLHHQRKGYGKLLYAALEEKLLELGYQNIYACVAVPEVEDEYLTMNSVNYHKYLGFEECGHFKKCGCKFNRWYDIVWLQKHQATTIPTKRPDQFTAL